MDLRKQDEDMHKEINDRADGIERHHANTAKETSKRLNALDLRISGLQGASGEQKRDINKLRDETNNLMVKSAAHDVELLNWEDCAQNMVSRVEKTWRQLSSQKYKSILDLVSKKADHSVLRLLQISQQHIESQLDR